MRWLPMLAAVATAAVFLGIAGARPALERPVGPPHHAVRPSALPGEPSARATGIPAPGQGVAVTPRHGAVAPPAPAVPGPGTTHGGADVSGGSAASQARTPSTGAPAVTTVVLTEADNGKTITVAPGTRILVRLQGVSHRQWTAPRALDSTVLSTSSSGRDPGGAAHGEFVAAHTGKTRVVASQEGCHGPLCLFGSSSPWQVHIVVA